MSKEYLDQQGNLIIEGGRVIYKDFKGEAGPYNPSGKRTFCVYIENPEVAQQLTNAGWNVKIREPKDAGEPAMNYIKVILSYKFQGPKVYRIINGKQFQVFEDMVEELDRDYIVSADLVIKPYTWHFKQGKNAEESSGISAYLDSMYAVIQPDPFYDKYNQGEDLDITAEAQFPTGTK